MRSYIDLVEKYTQNNKWFLDYMRSEEFDPYTHWWACCKWLVDNYSVELSELLGEPIEDAEDMQEKFEPDEFYKLPKETREECAEWVRNYVMQHYPAEASTKDHMYLQGKKLLSRETWLVHFSNHANQIAYNGFKYGADQMDRLGLTTYFSDSHRMSSPGYNFAFEALSRDAIWAASQGKYGRDAVIFQNSGVKCHHYGDEETQIVFHGPDVAPNTIIYLKCDGGTWNVIPKKDIPNRDFLFQGEYEDCVKWVVKNQPQYRRWL